MTPQRRVEELIKKIKAEESPTEPSTEEGTNGLYLLLHDT